METRKEGNLIAVRLRQGEDVISSLEKAVGAEPAGLGVLLSGTGMMKDVRLGYFMGKGTYKDNNLSGPREIVSATGNFVNSGGELISHIHVSLADDDSRVTGGHLKEARVHGTGEFFIYMSGIKAERVMEEDTGLKGLRL